MFFIFVHLDDVLIPSMTWNDLFWNCTDNKNKWRHFFEFVRSTTKPLTPILFLDSKYIFCKPNDLKYWKNYCRSAKLYYQMMLSLSWTYSSLKLPNVSLNKSISRMENRRDCNPREPAWKDIRKCQGQLDAQIFISHELSVRNQV